MFDTVLSQLAPQITNDPYRLQASAEFSHYLFTQAAFKHGRPVILPYTTPYLERGLDAKGLALVPEAGYAPLMHFIARPEAAEQMCHDAEAGLAIQHQIRGVVVSPSCYALLYQFDIGGQSLCCVFDAQDRTINRAFRPWLQRGRIPAVISSPVGQAVIDLPCHAERDWQPFMNQAAAMAVDGSYQRLEKFVDEMEDSPKLQAACGAAERVLGISLEQMLVMANFVLHGDETPIAD